MYIPQPGGCPPGVTPQPSQDGGYSSQGGQGTSPARVPPGQVRMRGVPQPGGAHPGYPPTPRYRTAHGVLDKRRSVYLLRSRLHTFLCLNLCLQKSKNPKLRKVLNLIVSVLNILRLDSHRQNLTSCSLRFSHSIIR